MYRWETGKFQKLTKKSETSANFIASTLNFLHPTLSNIPYIIVLWLNLNQLISGHIQSSPLFHAVKVFSPNRIRKSMEILH
ncbi:hypothetical protein RchiOBHm_Chr5g0079461 [Rosa chinensis]|uniref:Uncharacterized protein n=1 Tax=Rosa chinensis TaxID=74649 RepID=A0A2P6QMI9_ROSCH|nr:hypothetical protein RchiOBHm_Chr5g0079461 [Rosa chinensis]